MLDGRTHAQKYVSPAPTTEHLSLSISWKSRSEMLVLITGVQESAEEWWERKDVGMTGRELMEWWQLSNGSVLGTAGNFQWILTPTLPPWCFYDTIVKIRNRLLKLSVCLARKPAVKWISQYLNSTANAISTISYTSIMGIPKKLGIMAVQLSSTWRVHISNYLLILSVTSWSRCKFFFIFSNLNWII